MDGHIGYLDQRHRARGVVIIAGSFLFNGASSPAVASIVGNGIATITRSGVGTFVVTFADKYVRLLSAHVQIMQNTAVASLIVPTTETIATTKTYLFTVMTESAGTFAAADIAANANNRCYFRFELQNVSVQQ